MEENKNPLEETEKEAPSAETAEEKSADAAETAASETPPEEGRKHKKEENATNE